MREKDAIVSHLLFIEATSATGGIAVFGKSLGDLPIKFIPETLWDAFPCDDDHNDDCVCTVVPGPVPHQTQQLLFLAATPNHLQGAVKEVNRETVISPFINSI